MFLCLFCLQSRSAPSAGSRKVSVSPPIPASGGHGREAPHRRCCTPASGGDKRPGLSESTVKIKSISVVFDGKVGNTIRTVPGMARGRRS